MVQGHGFDNTVVLVKETTFATAPTTGYKWAGMVESFEPEESVNVDSRRTLGVRAPIALRQGQKEVDASMSTVLQNGRLFQLALGKCVDSGDATVGYTHTLTPIGKAENLPSCSIQNHNAGVVLTRTYAGGKVDSLTVSASVGEPVTVDADFLFSHYDTAIAVQTVTAELDNYYMFYDGLVKVNTIAIANVTDFELEIANNLDRKFNLNGANKPTRIEEGSLEVTASLTMDFTDIVAWNHFKNGDSIAVDLVLADPANTKRSFTISLTGGLYDTNKIAVSAEDSQQQELEAIFTGITIVAKDTNATLL